LFSWTDKGVLWLKPEATLYSAFDRPKMSPKTFFRIVLITESPGKSSSSELRFETGSFHNPLFPVILNTSKADNRVFLVLMTDLGE
jgi:hypothetical protein